MQIRRVDHIILYLQIVKNKFGRVHTIGLNSSDFCCRQKNVLRFFPFKKSFHCSLIFEFQFLMSTRYNVRKSSGVKRTGDCGPNKPAVAGDVYFRGMLRSLSL
jgi:hypothetical protein